MKILTYSEILSNMLTSVGTKTPLTNFNSGSVVRTLSEVLAQVVAELYAFAGEMLKQGFLDTATGFWLDRKANEYGINRKPALKTEGVVVFSRKLPKATNITIPANSIVTTPKDQSGAEYRYFTTQAAVLQAGETSVQVPVLAENAGAAYNAGPGSITKMKVFLNGVDAVTNPEGWISVAGLDEETDSSLRQRCVLAWETLAQGGTSAAYVSWALSVPGVKSAFVDDNLPRGEGTLNIYLMAESGPPGGLLLTQVQAVIDAHRPITADALVLSPEVVTVPIQASLTPRAGWDAEAIDAEARRRLAVYFGELEDPAVVASPLGVGKDVVVSQVVALLMAIPGVYSVDLVSPPATVVIAPDQVPALGTITLNLEAPSNE
jgi:uncharacterized phage protein gp47/JayE